MAANDNIGLVVTVDVSDRDGLRAGGVIFLVPCVVDDGRLKGSIAVGQQHAHRSVIEVRGAIGDDQVGLAVAVDVGDDHRIRVRTTGIVDYARQKQWVLLSLCGCKG